MNWKRKRKWLLSLAVTSSMVFSTIGAAAANGPTGPTVTTDIKSEAGPETGEAANPDTGGETDPDTGGTTDPDTGNATDPDTGNATDPDTGNTADPDAGHFLTP